MFSFFKKKEILCPACNTPLDKEEIHYTCSGVEHGRHEKLSEDKEQDGHDKGIPSSKGKIPPCPRCIEKYNDGNNPKHFCDLAICDNCHTQFPVFLLNPKKLKVLRIVLLGPTSAGKTVFKSAFDMEINQPPFKRIGLTYPKPDIGVLKEGKDLPGQTEDGDKNSQDELAIDEKKIDYLGFKIGEQKYFVVLYDFPGERFNSNDKSAEADKTRKVVENADAIFIMLDPTQNMVNSRKNIETIEEWINTEAIGKARRKRNGKNAKVKIAYIITKADKKEIREKLIEINKKHCEESQEYELLWRDNDCTVPVLSDVPAIIYTNDVKKIPDPNSIIKEYIEKNCKELRGFFEQGTVEEIDEEGNGTGKISAVSRWFIISALGLYDLKHGENVIEEERLDRDGILKKYQVLKIKKDAYRVLDPFLWVIYGE